MLLIIPLVAQEKLISFGVEFENVSDRNLIDNGGKAIITTPFGVDQRLLDASHEAISSKSSRAFFKLSIRPVDFISIYGKVGFTDLEWGFTVLNPPGEPGTPPQDIKFKGNIALIWGAGTKIKIIEMAGFKAEINADYLTYKPDGKFYIMGIEFKQFEEEQFRAQHGGGEVNYTIDTIINELSVGILLSKKFGVITPFVGAGYIDLKPKSNLVMEGMTADIGKIRYEMEFNSKMKDNIYLIGGLNINFVGPVNINIALRTKAVSTLLANLYFAF